MRQKRIISNIMMNLIGMSIVLFMMILVNGMVTQAGTVYPSIEINETTSDIKESSYTYDKTTLTLTLKGGEFEEIDVQFASGTLSGGQSFHIVLKGTNSIRNGVQVLGVPCIIKGTGSVEKLTGVTSTSTFGGHFNSLTIESGDVTFEGSDWGVWITEQMTIGPNVNQVTMSSHTYNAYGAVKLEENAVFSTTIPGTAYTTYSAEGYGGKVTFDLGNYSSVTLPGTAYKKIWLKPVIVSSVDLDKKRIDMALGEDTVKVTATVQPENTTYKTITWTSILGGFELYADPECKTKVALNEETGITTVYIKGTKARMADINAKSYRDSAKKGSCLLYITSLELNKISMTLVSGGAEKLTVTVIPKMNVQWVSSNPKIVEVDSSGNVTAVAAGKAVITATSENGKCSATCTVTVTGTEESGTGSQSSHTVTFHVNGHGTNPSVQTVAYNDKASKPLDPAESGWIFGGWYTDEKLSNSYDFSSNVTSDINLYAKWTKNEADRATSNNSSKVTGDNPDNSSKVTGDNPDNSSKVTGDNPDSSILDDIVTVDLTDDDGASTSEIKTDETGSTKTREWYENIGSSGASTTAVTIGKKPASVKVKVRKNKVKVSWKKIKKNKSGRKLLKRIKSIQVQYSTNRAFKKNVKTKKVGKKKTKVTLKLKKKTTYYIRVRYVASDGGVSQWSKVKKVKTK